MGRYGREPMTTADWALTISLSSMVISLAGFVWNVWSKFIYPKPRLRVGFGHFTYIVPGEERGPSTLAISVTNFGPAEVTIKLAIGAKKRDWSKWGRQQQGILNPIADPFKGIAAGPFGDGLLPRKLGVGEQAHFHLGVHKSFFQKDKLVAFGVMDTFDRKHWAPRQDVDSVRRRLLETAVE